MEDIVIPERAIYLASHAAIPLGILLLIVTWQYRNSHLKDGTITFCKTGGALILALMCQAFLHEYSRDSIYSLSAISLLSYLAMTSTLMLAVKTGIIVLCHDSRPNFGRVFIEATLALWISGWLLRDPLVVEDALGEWLQYMNMSTMVLLFCLLVTLSFIAIHKTMNWTLSPLHQTHNGNPLESHQRVFSWLIVGVVSILPIIFVSGFFSSTDLYLLLYNAIETYTFTIPLRLFML